MLSSCGVHATEIPDEQKRKERQKLTSTFQSYLCRMIEQFGGIKKIRKRMKIIFFISQTMDVKDM